jgi:mannose-6-phosphate isomerase-like protein (cupin superfamily)
MLISLLFSLLGTILLSLPPVLAVDRPVNPDLSSRLKMALTHLDFWNTPSDSEYVFDFTKQAAEPFKPGSVLNANVATWPILMDQQQSVAQLNFGPCAMLAPHIHPHATNIVVMIQGSVKTHMRAENGAIDRHTVLTPGKMTIFPKASVHDMMNDGKCSSS